MTDKDREATTGKGMLPPTYLLLAIVAMAALRLVLLGLALFLGAVTPFLVVPVFALLMEFKFIRVEEPMMAATFGDAWHAYQAKVRRWI